MPIQSLQIGRTALLTHQTAIEVTGNNLANIATRTYHRQRVDLAPLPSQQISSDVFVGRGVQILQIVRQVNQALEGRIRNALSEEAGSTERAAILSQIESIYNEMSDQDLSTYLSEFFNAWAELANRPLDNSLRSLVIQQGKSLASYLRSLRASLVDLRVQVDKSIDQAVAAVNDLLRQLREINAQIMAAEAGGRGASTLRDQRDALLAELANYLDITVNEQPSGSVDVYVGSLPILQEGNVRGVAVRQRTVDGQLKVEIIVADDGSLLTPRAGKLGALIQARENDVVGAIEAVDEFTSQLIWQVNRVYSQGQGTQGFSQILATNAVTDPSAVLNSSESGLAFTPVHGSFQIHVTQKSTGLRQSYTIYVDLDGIGTDTTLADLAAQIDALSNVQASITGDGRLRIAASGGDFEITFGDDTSGVLAALGINTFFTGKNAWDIAVNGVLDSSTAYLATTRDHVAGGNANALAVARLRTQALEDLGGLSLAERWSQHIEEYAIRLGQARQKLDADTIVRENLQSQQQAVSGVNADEETINLLAYQRAYQASARFLAVVDQMIQTLLAVI